MNAWRHIASAAREEHDALAGAFERPALQQRNLLMSLLATHERTGFGVEHGFAAIQDIDDFRRRVPIRRDDAYLPWLERVAAGEPGVLTRDAPVAFEATGGTIGAKLIPYTAQSLRAFRAGVLPWLHSLLERRPRIMQGLAYVAASPVTRAPRTLPCGLPLGLPSDAAYLGEDLLPSLAQVITVPPPESEVSRWRIRTLAHLARRQDLTFMSVWSPTFLLELLGSLPRSAESVLAELQGDTDATRRLERALAARDGLVPALWPNLEAVSMWMDGASQPYAQRVAELLPGVHLDAKGVLATESVITTRFDDRLVPALNSAFLEFVAHDEPRLAHELAEGETYRVVITTPGGLYRYDIGDEFICQSLRDGIPELRFIGRAGVVSDLVGEKLTDSFVAAALAPLPVGASLVPRSSPDPHYELWVDSPTADDGLASRIDARLNGNPQYAYARQLGQLRELQIVCSPGFAQHRARLLSALGGRLGDAKSCALILDRNLLPSVGRCME
ncbi:MAG TPA: GH3 auxin-responsive promoter family protein [Steroidobacteraceae bacterium]|nr:GH3 auxin-responsive promoter family protein [Steroidobacteraceae bacterium]